MKSNSKEVLLEFSLPEFNREDINVKLSKKRIFMQFQKRILL